MNPRLWTYADALAALERLVHGWAGTSASQDELRAAVQTAYEKAATAHPWTCLRRTKTVTLQAKVSGTASFDLTGGTYERQLTTTTAVLDSDWMNDASVMIDDQLCDIEDVKSTTVCTLSPSMCPVEDKTAESIDIFQWEYPLPADFLGLGQPLNRDPWSLGRYVPLEELRQLVLYNLTAGATRRYSIGIAEDLYNAHALYVWPVPATKEEKTLPYQCRARELRYSGVESAETAGTISVTAGSPTVTGSGTSFSAAMENSILRISSSTTVKPTGLEGKQPWSEQRVVKDVASATSLTLDANVAASRSGVKYCITDPIELNAGPYHAFLAMAKAQLALERNPKLWPVLRSAAEEALSLARAQDSPAQQRKFIGVSRRPTTVAGDFGDRDIDY